MECEAENEKLWDFFILFEHQWLVGERPYALNLDFLRSAAKDLDIATDIEFYDKLRIIQDEILTVWENKKNEGICDDIQREKCEMQFGEYLEGACRQCERNKEREETS